MSNAPPPYEASEKAPFPSTEGQHQPSYQVPPGGAYPPTQVVGPYPSQPVYNATGTTTIITAQPTFITGVMRFGEFPVQITCPNCNSQIVTACTYTDGTAVWLIALLICFFGGWLGCCLIPFCVQGLKDVTHSCPNCSRIVGSYKRM